MKITDVKVFPVDEDKLKAYATITFDNCFIVRDLKIISGNKGYFIAMPSKKRKDGTFRDVAHPLNSETRRMIEEAVLQVYEKENASGSPARPYDEDEAGMAGTEPVKIEGEADDRPEDDRPENDSGTLTESAEKQSGVQNGSPVEQDQPEEREKGAEENPVIEPSDDPEKAFGYEE